MNAASQLMVRLGLTCVLALTAGIAASETIMVPMRDGVKLATDVHLPPEGGPAFPVVLVRTVYGRQDASLVQGLHRAGIALVTQDTRGHGGSEGEKRYFMTDGWGTLQDGVDTVEWLMAQPWCDGKIGTWGSSALGMTSALLAPATQSLAAQVIHVAPSDFYDTYIPGGVPQRALSETYPIVMGYQAEAAERRKHPAYDDYWKQLDPKARAGDVTSPGFFVGGWFDLYPQGILDGFTSRQYHGGPGARGNNMLIIGPWPHGGEQTVGDFTFPEYSKFQWSRLTNQFLRHWLLGEDNKIMEQPAVHYYVLGDLTDPSAPGNEWRTADDWPPYPTEAKSYYLRADGSLHESPGVYVSPPTFTFDPTPDRIRGSVRTRPRDLANSHLISSQPDFTNTHTIALFYTFDPTDPVPSVGGPNVAISGGPRDQRPISSRLDVLKFQTAPLDAPVEVTGKVTVSAYVSTDAPDTDFHAKLIDIYPDGREINLCEGAARLKFHAGREQPQPVAPDTVTRLDIQCESISVVFNAGHRIGVLISSSNYPRFELNPNTGADRPEYTRAPREGDPAPTLAGQVQMNRAPGEPPEAIADQVLDPASVRPAHNTVYMDKARPSALVLPVRAD